MLTRCRRLTAHRCLLCLHSCDCCAYAWSLSFLWRSQSRVSAWVGLSFVVLRHCGTFSLARRHCFLFFSVFALRIVWLRTRCFSSHYWSLLLVVLMSSGTWRICALSSSVALRSWSIVTDPLAPVVVDSLCNGALPLWGVALRRYFVLHSGALPKCGIVLQRCFVLRTVDFPGNGALPLWGIVLQRYWVLGCFATDDWTLFVASLLSLVVSTFATLSCDLFWSFGVFCQRACLHVELRRLLLVTFCSLLTDVVLSVRFLLSCSGRECCSLRRRLFRFCCSCVARVLR